MLKIFTQTCKGLGLAFFVSLFSACPFNYDDILMLQTYHAMHKHIWQASYGTVIPESYLAAVISLETFPVGNWESERFEAHIYRRLLALKQGGKAFGSIPRRKLLKYTDRELRQFATSYGPTQMMGYHCLQINCSISDLKGSYHLQWAVTWMEENYGHYARRGNWEACLRIHNTGRPDGKTYHANYVRNGLIRMDYYEKWIRRKGKIF